MADYVTTPRGELISGISLTENFAMLVPGIAQLQIVQEELDRFVFRIVRGDDFGPASLEPDCRRSWPSDSGPRPATNANSSTRSPRSRRASTGSAFPGFPML